MRVAVLVSQEAGAIATGCQLNWSIITGLTICGQSLQQGVTGLEVYFGLFESRLFQFRDQKVDLRLRQRRVIATAEHEGLAVLAV